MNGYSEQPYEAGMPEDTAPEYMAEDTAPEYMADEQSGAAPEQALGEHAQQQPAEGRPASGLAAAEDASKAAADSGMPTPVANRTLQTVVQAQARLCITLLCVLQGSHKHTVVRHTFHHLNELCRWRSYRI